MTDWYLRGRELINCNCDYGCPCQFAAPPTYGNCEMVAGYLFDAGRYGEVDLAGTRAAAAYQWPGATHEGNGRMQVIVDAAATPVQRDALLSILHGRDTEPMATVWSLYAAMCTTQFPPLTQTIDLSIDVAARTGCIQIPGVFETQGEPIINPATGSAHRAAIHRPEGIEYRIAEMGSASTKSSGGAISLNLVSSYGQFANIHLNQSGVVD